jgi:hypothetical protein
MSRRILTTGLLVAATALVPGVATAQSHFDSSTWKSEGLVTSCDQIDVNFDEWSHVSRAEQTLTIPGNARLVAHLNGPNGLSVFRGSGSNYTVHACKAAAADGDRSGDDRLAAISVTAQNGEIAIKGPEGDNRWVVHLIIETPATASLDVSSENGPVALRDVSGKIHAHAENGPVSLDHCTGEIEATSDNGPISFRGSGGHLNLRTDNGPLDIQLEGNRWDEGQLEGRTENGPIAVSVARGYSSGVVVESDGYSPFTCSSCENMQRTWDDHARRVEIGSHPVVVHVSTTNGPVTVGTSRD